MEPSNAFSVITSIAVAIKDIKEAYQAIPLGILLPPTKGKFSELQNKIVAAEAKLDDAKNIIPQLGKLIRAYSDLISDVKIAGASADKFSELIELEPTLLMKFKTFFINKIRDEYSRVTQGIPELPKPKSTEAAKKVGNLEIISREIRDLNQQLRNGNHDDDSKVIEIAKNISNKYSDMASTLAELLKEILIGFDPSEN
jgi:DNA repair ATPase RecN